MYKLSSVLGCSHVPKVLSATNDILAAAEYAITVFPWKGWEIVECTPYSKDKIKN